MVHSHENWAILKFVSQSPICLLNGFWIIFFLYTSQPLPMCYGKCIFLPINHYLFC